MVACPQPRNDAMTRNSLRSDLIVFDTITDQRTASAGDLSSSHWFIAALNAERYGASFGPPVLQIASHDGSANEDPAETGTPLTVLIENRWASIKAANVAFTIRGRDASAAPSLPS